MEDTAIPLTALDLLHGFLDLHYMTPDLEDWSEDRLQQNPPRLIRLRRLKALFRAFGIKWDPTAFKSGDFLCISPEGSYLDASRYKPFLNNLQAELRGIVVRDISRSSIRDLVKMF